eukprot:s4746_g3.t1
MAYRQDATNSKLKQCHMELECGTLCGSTANLKVNEISMDWFERTKQISDVMPVEGSSGLETVGITLKMLSSLGCPTWEEMKERKLELAKERLEGPQQAQQKQVAAAEKSEMDQEQLRRYLNIASSQALFENGALWFAATTDRGPNEVAAKALRQYFSSLAVVSQTLRSVAKKFYHAWCALHGHINAKDFAYKLFPRCQAGRWLSTDVEKRIISCTQEKMEPVIQQVLGEIVRSDKCESADVWTSSSSKQDAEVEEPKAKKKRNGTPKKEAKPKQNTGVDLVNELALVETRAFSAKMGKYRRSIFCALLTVCGMQLWN